MIQGSSADGETLVHVQVAGDPHKVIEWALTAPLIQVIEETKRGARLKIQAADEATIAGVLRRMVQDGIAVTDYHREERRLEDAFIDMLGQIDRGTFKSPVAAPLLRDMT